jgi:hypothetical protein
MTLQAGQISAMTGDILERVRKIGGDLYIGTIPSF